MGNTVAPISPKSRRHEQHPKCPSANKNTYYDWDFSYGPLLGQTPAAMFPERSKRVTIDGVADVFDW
ncbi:uncharacterized protein G6M90_00g035980 [Metarhizium brunneum]|uniref:Uncharacterized protein n=1 Tax=Metarhizium brunneum TaxID=500148 RepID=A0A7D5UV21_9HYPO|nr:hypothetical protein G6M90_00g035980 [Metarhizium brunneum]